MPEASLPCPGGRPPAPGSPTSRRSTPAGSAGPGTTARGGTSGNCRVQPDREVAGNQSRGLGEVLQSPLVPGPFARHVPVLVRGQRVLLRLGAHAVAEVRDGVVAPALPARDAVLRARVGEDLDGVVAGDALVQLPVGVAPAVSGRRAPARGPPGRWRPPPCSWACTGSAPRSGSAARPSTGSAASRGRPGGGRRPGASARPPSRAARRRSRARDRARWSFRCRGSGRSARERRRPCAR